MRPLDLGGPPATLGPALEVCLRREGGVLHLVSRYRPRGLLLVLGVLSVLASMGGVRCASARRAIRLECSRGDGACVLSEGDLTLERFPVNGTARFEVRRAGSGRVDWSLVAVRTDREVPLLWGTRRDVEAAAAELNAFLEDPAQPEAVLDPWGRVRAVVIGCLVALNAVLILSFLYLAWDKETVFDRARGVAIRRLTLFPSTRHLRDFRAVEVRALSDERPVWLLWSPEYLRRRIALVGHDGAAWWVTLYQQPRGAPTDLEAAAAELARYLGLPLE